MSDKLDRIINHNRDIKSSKYLYGVSAAYFTTLNYQKAIEEKIRLSKELLHELLKNENWVLNERVEHINKAIDFNIALLNEIKSELKKT